MLILVGHSASGKTEIANNLVRNFGIKKIVTYTTRPMRSNEKNGVDYNFCSQEEFLALMKQKCFVETTFFNNFYYGTAKKDIKDDRVIILDPVGLLNFKKLKLKNSYAIFLKASRTVRFNRMISRGDKHEDAIKRLQHDQEKFNEDSLKCVDITIDTNILSINYLTNLVYETYMKAISSEDGNDE